MNDDSEKKISSLSKFDFLPEWEKREPPTQNRKQNTKKKEQRPSSKNITRQKTNLFKIVPLIPQKVIDIIKSKLRKDGITRPLDSIFKEIIDKNLYHVTVEWVNSQKKFLKYKDDDKYLFSKVDAANDLIFRKNVTDLRVSDTVTITTDFKNVLVCNKTKKVFPPTSHNLFNNIVDCHLLEQKIFTNREKYIHSLSQSTNINDIKAIKNKKVEICEFFLPNNRNFKSLQGVLDEIIENIEQYFTEFEKIRISMMEILDTKEYALIQTEIKSNIRNLSKDIERLLYQILKRSKFNLFNINKHTFVSAYQPNDLLKYKLSLQSEKILNVIKSSTGITVPVVLSNYQQLSMSKLDILKEIKWLSQIGMIRVFESGQINLTKS